MYIFKHFMGLFISIHWVVARKNFVSALQMGLIIIIKKAGEISRFVLSFNIDLHTLNCDDKVNRISLLTHQGCEIITDNCQALSQKPKNPKPRGLGLTLKSHRPQKNQVESKRKGME